MGKHQETPGGYMGGLGMKGNQAKRCSKSNDQGGTEVLGFLKKNKKKKKKSVTLDSILKAWNQYVWTLQGYYSTIQAEGTLKKVYFSFHLCC